MHEYKIRKVNMTKTVNIAKSFIIGQALNKLTITNSEYKRMKEKYILYILYIFYLKASDRTKMYPNKFYDILIQ